MSTDCSIFDGTNFQQWKKDIRVHLRAKRLGKVFDKGADAEVLLKGTAIIYKYSSSEVCRLIETESFPLDVLAILEKHYSPANINQTMVLTQKLMLMNMKEGDNLNNHISQFNNYLEQLKTLDNGISKQSYILTLLASLPTSFNTFVQTLNLLQKQNGKILRLQQSEGGSLSTWRGKQNDRRSEEEARRQTRWTEGPSKCILCGKTSTQEQPQPTRQVQTDLFLLWSTRTQEEQMQVNGTRHSKKNSPSR